MNLRIRKANSNYYTEVCKIITEVHKLHFKNRLDVYLDCDNPLKKEYFDDLLNSKDTKVFLFEDNDNKELTAYSMIKIMNTKNPICI